MKPARTKNIILFAILTAFCLLLIGCTETSEPDPVEEAWPASTHSDSSFSRSGFLMEMAFEVYSTDDESVSYTITNKTMESVTFDDDFTLEFFNDGNWTIVPFAAELSKGKANTLPGLQMCLVEVDLGFFGPDLPVGSYRIVRMIGDVLSKSEFGIAETRINVRDMNFGFEPLSSLPPEYDATDAQNDGAYVLMEDGPKNQDVVQMFADKVSLDVPAKLRTVLLAEDGGTLIRDIIFEPLFNGNGRYSVITDASRSTVIIDETEDTYSFLSIADIENKKKVCLSNYVSYSTYAPEGAPLELISPTSPDNIDLVATVEMRTEEKLSILPDKFLVFRQGDLSFATISRSGNTFGYFIGTNETYNVPTPDNFANLDDIKWMSDTQLLLSGTTADGGIYESTHKIEGD